MIRSPIQRASDGAGAGARARAHAGARPQARAAGGWSLLELLVGITVGLLLVVAASGWTLGNVRADGRSLAAARLSTDLQTAAGLVAADLRRSGYWGDAAAALQPASAGGSTPLNPYSAVSPAAAASDGVTYAYSRDALENGSLDSNEAVGHRLRAGVLETSLGGNGWQALTDPTALHITAFTVEPVASVVVLDDLCAAPCAASAADCPPRLTVRSVRISIVGRSAVDPNVVRSTTTTGRLRNDAVSGHCAG